MPQRLSKFGLFVGSDAISKTKLRDQLQKATAATYNTVEMFQSKPLKMRVSKPPPCNWLQQRAHIKN
jgi:hypothetical protein